MRIMQKSIICLALCALLGTFAACSSQSQPVSASSSEESSAASSSSASEAAPKLPEAWFGSYDKGVYSIVALDGERVFLEEGSAKIQTPFAGGYALGDWETSEYDKEWKTTHDEQTHYGLFDSKGELAVDLTPVIASQGITGKSLISNTSHAGYADGRIVFLIIPDDRSQESQCFVLNEKGELAFTFGRESDTLSGMKPDGESVMSFHDGVLTLRDENSDTFLIDVDGNILASGVRSLGYGYCKSSSKVCSYDGQVLFDAASLNGGDITNAELSRAQPEGSGIVYVTAEKVNPYGGENKKITGLYSVSESKWIVELGEELKGFSMANEGMLWVSLDGAVQENSASSSDSAASKTTAAGSVIMNKAGDVVFDSSMADNSLGIPKDFVAYHLHDGWWGISPEKDKSPTALVYIEDGVFKGSVGAPEGIMLYPNSALYSTSRRY